jgi:hypothetical protein
MVDPKVRKDGKHSSMVVRRLPQLKLREDARDVRLDGLLRHEQPLSYRLVRTPSAIRPRTSRSRSVRVSIGVASGDGSGGASERLGSGARPRFAPSRATACP